MGDSFETIAARVMPSVQAAYDGTLYGYAAELGYGLPELNYAASKARHAARRIADATLRADVLQLATMIAADLLAKGTHTPEHAGHEAMRRAWLTEAPSHNGRSDAAELPADADTLQRLADAPEFRNARPPLTDAAYETHNGDMIGHALQSLPARELALVTAYSAVDAHQSTRLPVAAIVRWLFANAPHVAAELGLTDGLPTGRRAVAFGAHVVAALQAFADAYTDTLHHDTHDSRRRCSRPAPTLYVLPERAGGCTPVPGVFIPARVAGTMAPEFRANATREQRAADHAAFSDAVTTTARPVPGVRPGVAFGHAIAGTGTAQRVQASRKRKRDGGIGSPMTRG